MARYNDAHFLLSAPDPAHLPADEGLEVAFAGRSNAGKSSALNALTGQRSLARISKTPGRTQQINVFPVGEGQRLIDLPGYGYAKVPERVRRHWQAALPRYLAQRRSLKGLIVIMDVRHPRTEHDRQMLLWAAHAELPCHVVLTKADKLRRGPGLAALRQVRTKLQAEHGGITSQLLSATKGDGVTALQQRLDLWLEPVSH